MEDLIAAFVTRLAKTELVGPVFNPYAARTSDPQLAAANGIRRQNLRLYFGQMADARPRLLLVGEAPGYRGCRLTGVPFTSEAIIVDQCKWPFGTASGYRKTGERARVIKEATATMIWSALDDRPPTLLWNAFPFHPHQPGQPESNRRPTKHELLLGAPFLTEVMALFRPQIIAAVGRCAAGALEQSGLNDYRLLRHPSHGGKKAFVAGLDQVYAAAGSR